MEKYYPEKTEKYLKRKKIKDNWIEKVKRIKKVSGLTLFIQKRFQKKKQYFSSIK
jgi:hypothetical protein